MKTMFNLYVVELDPAVRDHGRVRRANPQGDERCLYVGSTAHSPAKRFAQHKSGVHANRGYVTKYGKRLRSDLSIGLGFTSREEAEQAERELADSLRSKGFTVWSR